MTFHSLCISCLLSIHTNVPHIKKYLSKHYETMYLLLYIYKIELGSQCLLLFSVYPHFSY